MTSTPLWSQTTGKSTQVDKIALYINLIVSCERVFCENLLCLTKMHPWNVYCSFLAVVDTSSNFYCTLCSIKIKILIWNLHLSDVQLHGILLCKLVVHAFVIKSISKSQLLLINRHVGLISKHKIMYTLFRDLRCPSRTKMEYNWHRILWKWILQCLNKSKLCKNWINMLNY